MVNIKSHSCLLLQLRLKLTKAKNYISPEEPYFATFCYNCFQCFVQILAISLKLRVKKIFGIHNHKGKTFVSMKDEENTGD